MLSLGSLEMGSSVVHQYNLRRFHEEIMTTGAPVQVEGILGRDLEFKSQRRKPWLKVHHYQHIKAF